MGRTVKYKSKVLFHIGSTSLLLERQGYVIKGKGFNVFKPTLAEALDYMANLETNRQLLEKEQPELLDAIKAYLLVYRSVVKTMDQLFQKGYMGEHNFHNEMRAFQKMLDRCDKYENVLNTGRGQRPTEEDGDE